MRLLAEFDRRLSRVPVLHDVRDITLARNDDVALVSYENKVGIRHAVSCTIYGLTLVLPGTTAAMEA